MLAFPEIAATIPQRLEPVPGLPEEFLLTVFNPFVAAQKRQDLLQQAATVSRLPIVWCFSDRTYAIAELPARPGLIPLRNLTQPQLYYVYRKAAAYVSFSTYESFGWSLAEAFFMNLPVVSRRTGIVPFVEEQEGIHVYETDEELMQLLARCEFIRPTYDRTVFAEHSYRAALEGAVARKSEA